MNCHIVSTGDGSDGVMGCFSFGVRNQERENMLGLCQEHNLSYKLIVSKEGGASHHIQEWG